MKQVTTYRLLMAFMLVALAGPVVAQVKQTARFERENKLSDQEFIIISMYESGLALVRDKEKYRDGKQLWEVIRLDSTLQEVWTMEMDIHNRHQLVGYEYRNNLIYLLFRDGEHEANDLVLFTIHQTSQEVKRYIIKQEITFRVTHFSAMRGSAILGGYVSNEPAVLLYSLEEEKSKLIPGFFINDTELLDLRVNTNNTFNTLIVERTNKANKNLILKTFDKSGALLLEDVIPIDPKLTILTGITSTLVNDEMMLTGTWTEGNSKQASGIFTTLVDPFQEQAINYYDFGQFTHFVDYQSARKAASIKQKSEQARKVGAIPDFKTYAAPMRLEEQPNGFALLAEVYQPATSLNTYPSYNSGMPYYGYSAFGYNPFMNRYYNSPYQYNNVSGGDTKMIHSALLFFDKLGKTRDDLGLKLESKRMLGNVEQTADFIYHDVYKILTYKKEEDIFMVGLEADGQLFSDTVKTQSNVPGDLIRNDSNQNSAIRFWYKTNFYVWGYQTIRNRTDAVDSSSRYVFYINKVEIH